jgi:hypothetical protein
MSIASTRAGELSWSVVPELNCGALAVRDDGKSWNLAPLGPDSICTCIFLSSIVRVAVEPEESIVIVPLVWTRHCAGCIDGQLILQEDLFARVEETNAALDVPGRKRLEQSVQLITMYSLSTVSSAQVDDHVSGRAARDIENS